MRKLGIRLVAVIILVMVSPVAAYWWGLSSIVKKPEPSIKILTAAEHEKIWIKEFGDGRPRVKAITPYHYIDNFYCVISHGVKSGVCTKRYPGLRISALAIRNHITEQVRNVNGNNTTWHVTWVSYTIWVTQNWTIDEILATYSESYKK